MSVVRILLTGAKGQLGQTLTTRWKSFQGIQVFPTDLEDLNICDPQSVKAAFDRIRPDFCINAAAYTAVDKAETEKELAFEINGRALGLLSSACLEHGTTLLHISSDYVYHSWPKKLLTENSPATPKSEYGKSKLLGDQLIIKQLSKYYIFRTSWLYSEFGNNFVKTIIRLSQTRPEIQVVDDQYGSPTYSGDLAQAIEYVVLNAGKQIVPPYGIYNFSNEGFTTWYDFALKILEISGKNPNSLKRISTKDFGAAAPRPYNSKMSKKKFLTHFSLPLENWKVSLDTCIQRLS
jgi:dTDP-4-dehydrorhamnose reductase